MVEYTEVGNFSGVKALDAEIFAADLTTQSYSKWIIIWSASTAEALEVTYDSGSNWTDITGQIVATKADALETFTIYVGPNDTFNMREGTNGGTIDICRVIEEQ